MKHKVTIDNNGKNPILIIDHENVINIMKNVLEGCDIDTSEVLTVHMTQDGFLEVEFIDESRGDVVEANVKFAEVPLPNSIDSVEIYKNQIMETDK